MRFQQTYYASKTEKSPTNDLDWESYCAVNRMDGTESDDVCSPSLKTSQASDGCGHDDVCELSKRSYKSNGFVLWIVFLAVVMWGGKIVPEKFGKFPLIIFRKIFNIFPT